MPESDNAKAQRNRFEQAARELGVDLDEQKLKEALRKIAPAKPAENDKRKGDDG